jgi:hypothetical protein
MTNSLLKREGQEKAALLALQLLDPIGAILAGMFTLRITVPTVLGLFHGGRGAAPETVMFAWGAVLVLGNVLVPVSLLLLGFGYGFTRALLSKPLWFLAGAIVLVAVHVTSLHEWFESNVPQPGITATAMLCSATAYAFAVGVHDGLLRAYELLCFFFSSSRVSGSNQSQHRALAGELYLCGGAARGVFHDRNVAVGAPRRGELLLYGEQSARRGTLAVGSPGSSKTRSKIYSDFYWGLQSSPRAGALVFVTKRRATQDCYAIAKAFRSKEQIHVVGVGPGREHIDILSGMTHESIGDAIQDGLGSSNSDFWRHGPSAFVEGFIEIAKALAPTTIHVPPALDKKGEVKPGGEAYDLDITDTLPTLLKLISLDGRRLDAVFAYGFARADELEQKGDRGASALRELLHEIKERVLPLMQRDAKLGEELRQSVLPQLQPFARGPVRDAFCAADGIDLALLEKGHVILIEVDEAEHPRAVGTVVRMVFRRIVQIARERTASDRIGFLDPVILLCDEYTNYAAPGHVQAWNTVRESNFCATVGITSISALTKQLGGDRDAANAIVANFANKFFFEVDDKATRELARELIGQSVVLRRSKTDGTSRSQGSSGHPGGSGSHSSSGTSASESLNEHLEEVVDGSVWRALGADRDHATAIAFVRTPAGVKTDVVLLGVLDPTDGILTALPAGYGLSA